MDSALKTTRRGNPNFGSKSATSTPNFTGKWDPKKRYQFKLVQSYDKAKPRDRDTNEVLDNPYPPIYMIGNDGVGWNAERNEFENWRYVFGYSSIWVKDQNKPEPTKAQLQNPKNFIEFRNGSMFIMGSNTALMDAMAIQDIYSGVENPMEQKTKIYELVNEDKVRQIVRDTADSAYLAEKAAREATLEEMIPVALAFGINVDNPEEDEDRIRTDFILKAKAMPKEFSTQFVNPKNKYKYNVIQALQAGIISSEAVPGKMQLVDTGKVYFDLREGDVAEQFASLLLSHNREALALYSQIEKIFVGQKD